jgi:multiple sugar transport system permease protein
MANTQQPGGKPATRRIKSPRARRKTISFYLFVAPWLLGFVLLSVAPLCIGFFTSLTNYDGFDPADSKFIGVDNYARAFSDDRMFFSLGRTLLWAAINTPLWLIVTFCMALILNQKGIKGRGFLRTLYYVPSIVPVVGVVWIWKIILDNNFGLLNAAISVFRPGTALPFLSQYALQSLSVIALWTGLGSGMVIFLAGLQNIPQELKEAAQIDGANVLQLFRHVTLPIMTPVIFFQLVLGLISAFQQLVLPMLLAPAQEVSGWNPPRSSYLYMIHAYRQLFVYQRYGYSTALLWLLFVVIMALTLLVFRTARYWVFYEVEVGGGGQP